MIKRYKKMIALAVTMTFLTLLPVYSLPLPMDQAQNFIEKEQQVGSQTTQKNVLPILLGIAAVAAGVFLLVMLVSKSEYDISGVWKFHNDYITEGSVDYDSVWTFIPYYENNKGIGMFERNVNGTITTGQYTVVNKNEIVFQDAAVTEQYVGQFDNKTTMSGTFVIATGAKGNWTATKK